MFAAFSRRLFPLVFLFIGGSAFSQPLPNTLLWRISGKSLTQPSYLYGTMHLQDKRLFNFGDSVYSAIERTAGFATEIDFQEFVDSLFTSTEHEQANDKRLSRQKVTLDRKKLTPAADSLLRKFGINGNIVSKKALKDIRDYRMRKILQGGEMSTIVDAFLLALAQRQDKWTGGIEDLSDQLNLDDELGGDLSPEKVLYSEKEFQRTVEEMIKIYLAQDLKSIDKWSNTEYGKDQRDAVLTHRNVKMALRMDSLSSIRPTFFAIGAAHLPGDSGVIRLLRKKGFTVEPVFSATTFSGDEYASHLKQKEWKEIKADDSVFTIKMPGNPVNYNKFGETIKMKVYFDLTTMTFYLAGHANGYDEKIKSLDKMLQEMAKNIVGKTVSVEVTDVGKGGLQGREGVFEKDKIPFRIRLLSKGKTLFMLIAGAMKKTTASGNEAARFFDSFVAGEVAERKNWKEFSIPGKAFTVQMPGQPARDKETDGKIKDNPTWTFTTYQSLDAQTNYYYLAQTRDVKPGLNMENDSSYLEALKEDFKTRLDTIVRFDMTTYKGYPAAYMDYEMKKISGVFKALLVIRGNRIYLLIGGAPKGSDLSDIDFFLQSLTMQPYEPVNWQRSQADGFSTWTPAPFIKKAVDSTLSAKNFFEHYCSYNDKDNLSYEVFKIGFSPTYWTESDTAYFNAKLHEYKGENDSLLRKEWVQNGTLRGVDYLIQPRGKERLKKVRLLVNKDTLYTLYSVIPLKELSTGNYEKFFDEFRVNNEFAPTIFTSKADLLLQTLNSKDSLQFTHATEDLKLVSFHKEELPLLHKSLLRNYLDSNEYNSTHNKLIDHVLPLADSTTLEFVEKEYPQLVGDKEPIRYKMLLLLSAMKTSQSYALLKRLLLNPLPKQGNPIPLQAQFLDSLHLTTTLFPELLQKADDSLLAQVIAVATNRLLGSGLLTKETILPFQEQILKGAKNEMRLLETAVYEPWELIRWAELLGWLNVPEGNLMLQKLVKKEGVYLRKAAILALLKNNQVVPATEVAKVAADKGARIYFYEALKQIGKEGIIPLPYAGQKSLAESEAYNLFTEDYENDFTLSYVGERITVFEGKKSLFYLFKVRLPYDDDIKEDYLVVTGPYTPDAKEKVLFADATGYYTDEAYQPQKIDKLLKAYLLSLKPAEK